MPTDPPSRSRLSALVQGFGWIGLLYGLAKASTLLTQVAAGRWLGPGEFGRASLAMAVAAYLQILPILGFPLAMSKFVAAEPSEPRRLLMISTMTIAFLGWAGLSLALVVLARGPLARAFGLPTELLAPAIALAFATALYTVLSSSLLGLKRFDLRGTAEALYGLSAPLLLAAFVAAGPASHRALIATLCLGLACGTLYSLWALRDYLRPSFDARSVRPVLVYAAVATLSLLAAACVQAPPRLLLHRAGSAHAVGIFSAYFTATAQVSLALLHMLSSVLVPLASDERGQQAGWSAYRRAALGLGAAAWAGFFACAAAALWLFGRQYPFRPEWALLFSAAAALILLHGIAATLLAARGLAGLLVAVAGGLLAGGLNVALDLALIPRWGTSGAALALVLAYLGGGLFYLAWGIPPARRDA